MFVKVQVWRVKVHVFSTIKVNLVAKIMQSTYLFAIFHLKHKKNHHFSRFQPDF